MEKSIEIVNLAMNDVDRQYRLCTISKESAYHEIKGVIKLAMYILTTDEIVDMADEFLRRLETYS